MSIRVVRLYLVGDLFFFIFYELYVLTSTMIERLLTWLYWTADGRGIDHYLFIDGQIDGRYQAHYLPALWWYAVYKDSLAGCMHGNTKCIWTVWPYVVAHILNTHPTLAFHTKNVETAVFIMFSMIQQGVHVSLSGLLGHWGSCIWIFYCPASCSIWTVLPYHVAHIPILISH